MKNIYTGIMVLLVALSGLAFAQPAENQDELQPEHKTPPPPHAQSIIAGKGFALAEDGGYHVLSIEVVKKNIQPGLIMRMLKEHRPIDEILNAIREMYDQGRVRGFMSFAGEHYVLNVTEFSKDSLTATVLKFSEESEEPVILGSIAVTAEEYEGSRIATGALEMDGAVYEVLLHVFHGKKMPPRKIVPQGQREKMNKPGAWEERPRPRDMPDNTRPGRGFGPRGPPF
jgi:hypothetical protein